MNIKQKIKAIPRALARSKIFWFLCLLVLFVYLNNTSLFVKPRIDDPPLLAHRGLAQTFDLKGVTHDTCTAERIHPPEHPYLENTIASMRAALRAGADIVELDVQLTKDDRFAVFHDHLLDCRTNGSGKIRTHTIAELKKLDIGYGYTANDGKTYPFRGKGVGMMPTLDEVLQTFPQGSLLIHVKSAKKIEGKQLAKKLAALPEKRLKQITVYGGDQPIAALEKQLPKLRTMSKASMKKCLIPYLLVGWTGIVPDGCANTQLHIPEGIGPWLWGWPHRLVERMEQVGTRTVIVGGSGGFSSGFDTAADLKRLPDGFQGAIWTNRVDRIAPLIKFFNK